MTVPCSAATILFDIEGTTSSISFVHDVMFPFVRRELEHYLEQHWGEPSLVACCEQMARDAGHPSFEAWHAAQACEPRGLVRREVFALMDRDVKATGLKQLQGAIWRDGFESGELRAHVYPDVPDALARWRKLGLELRIYSSGSVDAQRLFFRHTIEGDLLGSFAGHYDTTIGSKREPDSYQAIVRDVGRPAPQILFVSDVVDELNAARAAGLQTVLSRRPGNPVVASDEGHPAIDRFDELVVTMCPA